MGQGTESCGGYDIEYDPYEDAPDGMWTTKNGGLIHVSNMTKTHLRGAIRICERASLTSTFSCDIDKWNSWIQVFEDELFTRDSTPSKPKAEPSPTRGAKQKMKCHCGTVYEARKADLKRGWAKSCSKSCASVKREYGRPDATIVK